MGLLWEKGESGISIFPEVSPMILCPVQGSAPLPAAAAFAPRVSTRDESKSRSVIVTGFLSAVSIPGPNDYSAIVRQERKKVKQHCFPCCATIAGIFRADG